MTRTRDVVDSDDVATELVQDGAEVPGSGPYIKNSGARLYETENVLRCMCMLWREQGERERGRMRNTLYAIEPLTDHVRHPPSLFFPPTYPPYFRRLLLSQYFRTL